jgi:hypothetical protein
MMDDTLLRFTVPLAEAYRQAEQFSQVHRTPKKQQQVRLNTLAVWAVDYYLRCLGIDTNLAGSNSWDRVSQALLDTGELSVPALGEGKTLECRPVLPGAETVYVPPETREHCCGYLVVQIDESQKQGVILGFFPTVQAEYIPLRQLRPLEEFLDQIASPVDTTIASLSRWLQGVVDEGWQTLDQVFGRSPMPSLAFRSMPSGAIARAVSLDLGMHLAGHRIALVVTCDAIAGEEIEVVAQVHPLDDQATLPPGLTLIVAETNGDAVLTATARQADNYIQLLFGGVVGERFSIQVVLGDYRIPPFEFVV